MSNMIKKAIKDLAIGDFVDLQGDKFADCDGDNVYLECELVQVMEIDFETNDCVAVGFEGFDVIGFPLDHEVMVLDDNQD